jgi:uncharacterized protein (TIGR04255 family)
VSQNHTHYRHAPISEAVIDLHCELPSSTDQKDLFRVHSLIKDSYPKQGELRTLTTQVAPGSRITSEELVVGYRFANESETRVVLARRDGFSFSWLAPYDHWEPFRAEARRLWDVYASALKVDRVARVGVRYVNRIDIPVDAGMGVELDHYFRTGPRIAPELPQELKSFFVRLQLPLSHLNEGMLIVTQTALPPSSPQVISTILDIDAVVAGVSFGIPEAWDCVEKLRAEKNLAFEACITDRVRDLIK